MNTVFGISGWKNSGKTTLVAALVTEFSKRGYRVSTIKHAHDGFDIDHEGTDSFAHRKAGAHEVTLVSSKRWAIMHEVESSGAAPTLDRMLAKMAPCDLVIVEGFKNSSISKIECIREESKGQEEPIWKSNQSVIAIASDVRHTDCELPQFVLEDVPSIADYIAQISGLGL